MNRLILRTSVHTTYHLFVQCSTWSFIAMFFYLPQRFVCVPAPYWTVLYLYPRFVHSFVPAVLLFVHYVVYNSCSYGTRLVNVRWMDIMGWGNWGYPEREREKTGMIYHGTFSVT